MSADWFHPGSSAFTSAPALMSAVMAPGTPAIAARCNGVTPSLVVARASAREASNCRTMAVFPAALAMCSGWYAPTRVVACTDALALSSTALMTESPRCAAQCNAVMPSPCATLALAPLANRARTVARSPCIAASATGAAAGSA